jgi:multiple sugar transport system substrate-binding protein
MKRPILRTQLTLAAVAMIVAVACTASPSTASPSQSTPRPTGALVTAEPSRAGGLTSDGKVLVRWFVGLGTGGNPEQLGAEQAAVAKCNAQDGACTKANIRLALEVYQNDVAYDTLATQIATKNGPDIIGPIGIRALNGFGDQLLDLSKYVQSKTLDTTGIEKNLIDQYLVGGKQIGIPYAVYPSYMYYNKALFKEAGLKDPPHKVGDKYTMPNGQQVEWNWDAVAQLAKLLTVDSKGNDATKASFDPKNVTQFGFDFQWTDPRGWATAIGGSGSVVAGDGKTAQWPDNWKKAMQWYYDRLWKDHTVPTQDYITALAGGNTFQSGKVAMDFVHTWYTCCVYPGDGTTPVKDWDIAVAPVSFDGKVTAKLHADTMGVLASSVHADAAVLAMNFIMTQPDIVVTYGALPARASDRKAFFDALDKKFATLNPTKVDWQVASSMLSYTETVNHEANMPNFLKSDAVIKQLQSDMLTNSNLNMDTRIADLIKTLQSTFGAG